MKGPKPKTNEERFWAKVDKSGDCWEWTAARIYYHHKNGTRYGGYGIFGVYTPGVRGHKMMLAHRFAWTLTNGPIPEGIDILHSCDNPPCVLHLFAGTAKTNGQDMAKKGRSGKAKLTIAEVRELRSMTGTNERVGRAFGIGPSNVSRIRRGQTWDYPEAYPPSPPAHERNGHKLTASRVREIRVSSGSDRAVGLRFGVTKGTIFRIRHQLLWDYPEAYPDGWKVKAGE